MGLFTHICGTENHRFEGRYDEVFDKSLMDRLKSASDCSLQTLKLKKYIKDVCIYCGKEQTNEPQYVKGLVEALKFYAEDGGWRNSADMGGIAQQALQQLPEDWR